MNDKPYGAIRFLRWFCPPHLLEEIEGDLVQQYTRECSRLGVRKARIRLWSKCIQYFRIEILIRNRISKPVVPVMMIRNNLLIAFRTFRKQLNYSVLNVLGLSVGIAASLLIFQYVRYEQSFDRFHTKADRIYRIQYNGWVNGKKNFESAVAVPMAPRALKDNFPEVEEFTRFFPTGGVMSRLRPDGTEVSFYETKMQFVDPSVFRVFDFSLLKGDPNTALDGVDKAVISERAAKKYFGEEDPLGKRMQRNGKFPVEITGVFRDVPENSHIRFDFLFSYATLNRMTRNSSETAWGWYDFYSFVLLKPGTNVAALQEKWDNWLQENRGEEWKQSDEREEFILRPLTDIHLYSHLLYEAQPEDQRDGDAVQALQLVGIFILIIAWVNYINLSTARSVARANEVGVRKAMGAFRFQLIGQFLTESFLLNLLAGVLALCMVWLSWSAFGKVSGWNIPIAFMTEQQFWLLAAGLLVGGAILSGFYPALVLSSFRPVKVLKGKILSSGGGQLLRKGLVIFQYAISVFLIIGSMVVYQQIRFMKNQDLGMDINQTLVLKGPGVVDSLYDQKLESFRHEVLNVPGVKRLTASSAIPGFEIYWTSGVNRLVGGFTSGIVESHMGIDHDFVEAYSIPVIAGRTFNRDFPSDSRAVLLNRAMTSALDFHDPESAIGQLLNDGGDTVEVIGVLADFHQMSLKDKVAPLILRLSAPSRFYSLKVETSNYKELLANLEGPWKTFFPGNPLDYFLLDGYFNRQYEKDDRFAEVFGLFTILAIGIASLGLFGLASFMTVQRTKEIGIRKVLGSSVSGIVFLLARSFLKPVLIANLIAWPLAAWLMNRWLEGFPYRITISLIVFGLASIAVLALAFVSVSSQTLKAALTKPTETLKYE